MNIAYYLGKLPFTYRSMAFERVTNLNEEVNSISEALCKGWDWKDEEYYFWDKLSEHYLLGTPVVELESKLIWPQP